MRKTKIIKLSYPHIGREHSSYYRVEQIQESTEFDPKQLLEKKQVDELCEAKDWRVTIVPSVLA